MRVQVLVKTSSFVQEGNNGGGGALSSNKEIMGGGGALSSNKEIMGGGGSGMAAFFIRNSRTESAFTVGE